MIFRFLLFASLLVMAVGAQAKAQSWAARRLALALAHYDAGRFDKARRGFEDLADHNSAIAETMLGVMYAKGRGVRADPATAFVYYYRAANRGYAPAQLALSDVFANGKGTLRNLDQAYLWARLAAQRGDTRLARAATIHAARLARVLSTDRLKLIDRELHNWRPWVEMPR